MKVLRSKPKLVLLASFVVGALAVGGAVAAVISQQVIVDNQPAQLRVIRTHVDDGGFDSGWHTHPGPVMVQVQSGHLKIYQGACHGTDVGPGDTFIEVPYLPVRGIATHETEWTTSIVLPAGAAPTTPTTETCGD